MRGRGGERKGERGEREGGGGGGERKKKEEKKKKEKRKKKKKNLPALLKCENNSPP